MKGPKHKDRQIAKAVYTRFFAKKAVSNYLLRVRVKVLYFGLILILMVGRMSKDLFLFLPGEIVVFTYH